MTYPKKTPIISKPRPLQVFSIVLILMLMICSVSLPDNNIKHISEPHITTAPQVETPIGSRGTRSNYTYHNYSTLMSDLEYLNQTYPTLVELYTAQDAFGLPPTTDGYMIPIVRITNESLGFNKPEVLFIGGHHGNEHISVEAPYYLIEFLVQNYATEPEIRFLLDNREIYVMPVLNPWGWENGVREDFAGEDMNRDYPYTQGPGTPLTTIGARAVTELMKRHLFLISLSWHSGEHLIYYAWGTPTHDTPSDESPDNVAFFEVAKQMSAFAGGESKYNYGPANQMFYTGGVLGAWSDYAYAASWDTDNLTSGYETTGANSLAIGVEISTIKKPAETTLGNAGDVLYPTGSIAGFIPQNIRMALVIIDLAEPYLNWKVNMSSGQPIPSHAPAGSKITLNWTVNGSFTTTNTRILYGSDSNPKQNFKYSTENQSADRKWTSEYFTNEIKLPDLPGDYFFIAEAQVDQRSLIQVTPVPDIPPQSLFVNQRTNNSWNVSNNGNTLEGKTHWYSSVIKIKVTSLENNQVWINDQASPAYSNEAFNLSWTAITDGVINYTEVYWGQHEDPRNHSGFMTSRQNGIPGVTNYFSNLLLPSKPGIYYFTALMSLVPDTSPSMNGANEFWSPIIVIEIKPRVPYELNVSLPLIDYVNGFQQTLSLFGITVHNLNISENGLNDKDMLESKVIIRNIYPMLPENLTLDRYRDFEFDLEWSETNNYWYLPVLNTSTWAPGPYVVVSYFLHKYGEGQSYPWKDFLANNWFDLNHIIIVKSPTVKIVVQENNSQFMSMSNITVWCSNSLLDLVNDTEADIYAYDIRNLTNDQDVLTGDLEWSEDTNTWHADDINISILSPGNYYVVCRFWVNGISAVESVHIAGDKTEFTLHPEKNDSKNNSDNDEQKDEEKSETPSILIPAAIIVIILIMFVIFLLLLLRIRKDH